MSFEVSSSDSNFLSDSTLVLEPIVPFEDSSFQNSGFPFLLFFWRSGFRLGFSLFMSFEVSSSDSNFLSDSTLVLEPIVPLKIRVFQNSGFPFLFLFWRSGFRLGFSLFMSFEVSSSDSNFLSDSTLVLEPIVPLKIRVFQNSGFPFLLLFWRSGFRLGFSLFMSFEVSSSDSNFLSDSTLVLEPIVPLKIRVFQNSGFPFLLLFWRSGFRLGFSLFMSFEVSSSDSNFLSDSTLVLEPIVPLKIRVFQNSGFPFLLLFWRSGFRLGFSLFISFEVSSSDSNFLSDSTLVLEPIVPLKIRVFQNSGFPFLFLFWRSGFRLGFFLFMSFEVSSSDSNFLSNSTLVLEPIVPLKIRVFQNSTQVFPFLLLFWRFGFRLRFSKLGFCFLYRLKFRVPTRTSYRIQRSCWNRSFLWKFEFFKTRVFHFYSFILKIRVPTRVFPFYVVWSFEFRLELPIGFNARVGTDRSFENSSFQNSGFPFLLLFWRSGFRLGFSLFMSFKTRVFHFYYYVEDPGSDSGFPFLCHLKFRVPTRTSYRIQRSCWNGSFLWGFEFFKTRVFRFYNYFEDPGSDSGFPFLCRLKFRVPTRTSYQIQSSCWNRSLIEDSSFSILGFSIFIFILKIRVLTRVFPFYVIWSFEFPLELPIGFNARDITDHNFENSSFQNSSFPFLIFSWRSGFRLGFSLLCRLKLWVPTQTSYRIQRSCWNRSFLWRFEFFKTRVFHFYFYFEDPGSDSGFSFLCRLKFRVPTRTSYQIQSSCWNRSFLWKFEFSKLGFSIFIIILKIRVPTRVFPFYVIWSFEFRLELPIGFNARVGTDRSFEDSSFSKLGFSIFIFILKIRVPTRVFPFYVIWSFEFRLELPIGFNARVGTDRSFKDSSFSKLGFSIFIIILKIRVPTRVFPFYVVWSFEFLLELPIGFNARVGTDRSFEDSSFQNSGFSFLLLFWRSGFRLGFSPFMSFRFSSSDSNFLSDSTLVLELIVPLKIRVFQNSGFPFLLLFWRSGFRLGFSLFMSFEVSSSDSNFLSDSKLVLEPIVPLKIRVFKTRVFHFYYYFEDPGSDWGFPFLCRLKFRVPTRTSYQIQGSCWNRSFLCKFEFSKLGFSIFIIILKIRVPTQVFPFYVVWSFEFRLKLPIEFNARAGTDRSFEDSSFSKLGFSIFIIILKIRVPTQVFPFYIVWSFEFRLELPIGFNARVGTDH